MSVSAVANDLLPLGRGTPLPEDSKIAQKSGDGGKGGAPQGASTDAAAQITNQLSTTNPDGSTTTSITYADGTTTVTTTAAPTNPEIAKKTQPNAQSGGTGNALFDPTNVGQNAALLAAQEQSRASS